MRSRMSPTGHVLFADLPDRQYLLGSSRRSCNKNITYTTTYSHHYIRLYTFIYTHINTSIIIYPGTNAFAYSCAHVLMYSCTNVLMYSCTHVLMFSSSQRITYCYRLASISTKKNHRSIYCTYLVQQII